MSYLLSIIVPTKNRYIYLKSIVETFKHMDNGEIELVIQDNSDDNKEILQFLGQDYSKNIKYYYYEKHMTVSDNFSMGISNSLGLYVCMLGDDDAVSSKITTIVKYMGKHNIESAIFNKAKYNWPDMEFRAHKIPSLVIPKSTGKIKVIDPKRELKKCLSKGTTSLMRLPEIYQGIVKRTTLDKIFNKCNTYFPGASPDMAIAIALSLVVKSHIYVDAPYTISGQAYVSAGGKGARHQHKGRLKDMNWLPVDIEEKWEARIPKIWTGSTIYAESAHKALRFMENEELIKEFNYLYQYAWFKNFNSEYKDMVKPLLKDKLRDIVKMNYYITEIFILRLRRYVRNALAIRMGLSSDLIFENLATSSDASIKVDEIIDSHTNLLE